MSLNKRLERLERGGPCEECKANEQALLLHLDSEATEDGPGYPEYCAACGAKTVLTLSTVDRILSEGEGGTTY